MFIAKEAAKAAAVQAAFEKGERERRAASRSRSPPPTKGFFDKETGGNVVTEARPGSRGSTLVKPDSET